MPNSIYLDTIVAIATPIGVGGVGIIRISGNNAYEIANKITGKHFKNKEFVFSSFKDKNNNVLDKGIVLYFEGPNSFTGENVIELQGHGGPVILNSILETTIEYGARMAEPGEFSKRAFLNSKIDLTQAEAIADLINAKSTKAAQAAMRTLNGDFAKKINLLVDKCIEIRTFVEASIDFSEEEIDEISLRKIGQDATAMLQDVSDIISSAKNGVILNEGIHLTLAGVANAGKSTLFNRMAGYESAIVTDIPGTTRDVMREPINLDGMLFNLRDTAGFRETEDYIEKEGLSRTQNEMEKSDHILWVEGQEQKGSYKKWLLPIINTFEYKQSITIVRNKVDLIEGSTSMEMENGYTIINISAKYGDGMSCLYQHLKDIYSVSQGSGDFIARTRHVNALNKARESLQSIINQMDSPMYELLAEDLRIAQNSLSEITGAFSNEDLLGNIFSSFCIGK